MSRIWSRMQNFEFIDFSFKRNHLKDTLNYILSWDNGTVSLTRLARFNPWPGVRFWEILSVGIFLINYFYFICFVHRTMNLILKFFGTLMDWIVGSGSIFPSVLINRKFSNTRATYFWFDSYISCRERHSIRKINVR